MEAELPTEVPIACSLSEADLAQRLTEARTLGADALAGVEAGDRVAVLHFSGAREAVDRFVEAESRCCGSFAFEVTDRPEGIELRISAPEVPSRSFQSRGGGSRGLAGRALMERRHEGRRAR